MKIIVVDDQESSKNSLTGFLVFKGYVCIMASNGAEALRKLENESVNVVITDINMPGMDGMKLLKALNENYPKVRVIITTGYPSMENAIEAVNNGAYAFFTKPVDVKSLCSRLYELESELKKEISCPFTGRKKLIGSHQ